MNFTSLQYFLQAAEDLNFTHTASKLYISQQALSGHIIRLEKELGIPLFNRTPTISLTIAGEMFANYASQILSVQSQIFHISSDINDNLRGSLKIGLSHTCGRAILPAILPLFRENHPLIDIQIMEGNSSELETWLHKGELDLIIGFAPFIMEGIRSVSLIRERLFLVVPKRLLEQNFGACYDSIKSECQRFLDLSLFSRMPFILLKRGNRVRNIVDSYMAQINFKPNIILEIENIETAFSLSEEGMGLTVYPELFRICIPKHLNEKDEKVEFFAFPGETTVGSLEIAWIHGRYQSRAIKDFVELCTMVLPKLQFHFESS
ncbi:MAG: LysR family transcriptional regulator [Oscillospiraceae bacterium]|nr:LysR family transcriptional regulator [Oscillospiraceae bacterium]